MSESSVGGAAGAGDGLFSLSRPDIPTDDWDDQDLLTKDEAGLRLRQSAALLRRQLAETDGSDPAAVSALETQIQRIDRVLERLRPR
jgi:hypothetical protein